MEKHPISHGWSETNSGFVLPRAVNKPNMNRHERTFWKWLVVITRPRKLLRSTTDWLPSLLVSLPPYVVIKSGELILLRDVGWLGPQSCTSKVWILGENTFNMLYKLFWLFSDWLLNHSGSLCIQDILGDCVTGKNCPDFKVFLAYKWK